MNITYEFTRKSLRTGMWNHLFHRNLIGTLLLIPGLGVIFVIYGMKQLLMEDSTRTSFGVILLMLGFFYLVLNVWRVNRAIKNAFQPNPNDRHINLTLTESAIELVDGASSGTSPYSSFVDFKICKKGLLLYPQKNLFYWIPTSADIEGGTWLNFTDLIASRITKKL